MEREELLRQNKVLDCLSHLPKRILSLHGRDNITEFVLHDLSHEQCFNLRKAAFFVNNPDFNCLKGVAGVAQRDIPQGLWNNIWEQKEMFSTYMRNAPFNRKVRGFAQCSLEKRQAPSSETIEVISRRLGIEKPSFYSLDMKHDNHGLLVFEKSNDQDYLDERCFLNGVSLLGFCPVF